MASYTDHQYRLQHAVMLQVRWSGATGKCPVCRTRPSAVWPDGVKRVTCGDSRCYVEWLPVRGEPAHTEETDHADTL